MSLAAQTKQFGKQNQNICKRGVFLLLLKSRVLDFKGFKLHYPKKLVIIYMLFQQ